MARELRTAAQLAPDAAEYHYELALVLNETGDATNAVAELEQAVKLDPRPARAWYSLGLARERAGALVALERAGDIKQSSVPIIYARALILNRMGRRPEAQDLMKQIIKLQPDFAPARDLQK